MSAAAEAPGRLRTLPDLLRPGLELVFVGINPGERSARLGHYYGHPGNAFWPALSASGLVPRDVGPEDDRRLPLDYGIGFTDVVKRVQTDSTRVADAELRASAPAFRRRIAYASPRAVCFTTTRAFDVLHPRVRASGTWGRQPVQIAGAEGGVVGTLGRAILGLLHILRCRGGGNDCAQTRGQDHQAEQARRLQSFALCGRWGHDPPRFRRRCRISRACSRRRSTSVPSLWRPSP